MNYESTPISQFSITKAPPKVSLREKSQSPSIAGLVNYYSDSSE
jgi:hypothetical protein